MKNEPRNIPQHASGWQRRKRARPGEILEAALRVFADKGYAATRMEDIARASGVTKGTIYLYFANKEALFKNLIQETVAQALATLEGQQRAFDGNSHDLLILQLTAICDYLENDSRAALPKIIISECGNFPDFARYWSDEIISRALGLIAGTIRRGVKDGEFRPTDPAMTARIAVSPIILATIWRVSVGRYTEPAFDTHEQLSTHLDLLLHGLEVPHYGRTHQEVQRG